MKIEDRLDWLRKERGLRRRGTTASVEDTWSRIQKEESLSTKEKLENLIRLTRAKSASRPEPSVPFEPAPREALRTFENSYSSETRYGRLRVADALSVRGDTLWTMSREDAFRGLDLSTTLFLDLETTGLAGGTGTLPFLVGLGYFREASFVVAQYFLGDPSEEERMIAELAAFFRDMDFRSVVTYNGKAFDIPLLETRFILKRTPFPLAGLPHLDFLFAARSLWKHKHDSCRLFHLAREVVEAPRDEDIPGAEIPHRYFDYIRMGDFGLIEPILYHNQEDILSLLGLVIAGARLIEDGAADGGEAPDALDLVGVGRILANAGDTAGSARLFERALIGTLPAPVAATVVRRLSLHFKRSADWGKAVSLWQGLSQADQVFCFRELAMYYEHRTRDLERARQAAEEGLALALEASAPERRDFEKRLARLSAKLARGNGAGGKTR